MLAKSRFTTCDICCTDLQVWEKAFDAKIPGTSTWADLCKECANDMGVVLGTGRGQEYDLVNGQWLKVKG